MLLGRSHISILSPLKRQGTEVSLTVGHHGYMVSVWNSSFRLWEEYCSTRDGLGVFFVVVVFLSYL